MPSTVQWAYGQRWYGCEVVPATDSYPIAWTGTAHLAGLGVPPAVFATCAQGIGGQPVDCSRPHTAEQLTWNDQPADAEVTGCYALAGAIMKTADPTYAGALVVANRKVQNWTECWVATQGSARLTGTLIGHGTGPLPLTLTPMRDHDGMPVTTEWPAPVAAGPVRATVRIPGSKSLTNRALVLAAQADRAEPAVRRACAVGTPT